MSAVLPKLLCTQLHSLSFFHRHLLHRHYSMCPVSLSCICSSFAGPKVTWASFQGSTWLQHPKIWKINYGFLLQQWLPHRRSHCISPLDLCFRFVLWLECPLAIQSCLLNSRCDFDSRPQHIPQRLFVQPLLASHLFT